MQKITASGMKDRLSLPGLGWKYFNSLRTDEDEPIYSYNDKYMSWFVRQSFEGGRVCAFNQFYKSETSDDVVERNIFVIIEAYSKKKNKHLENIQKEYESKFDVYRDIIEEVVEKRINENICKLPIHQLLNLSKIKKLLWAFDSVSLYPSAIWDEKSIYPRSETGYSLSEDMNDELVNNFNY